MEKGRLIIFSGPSGVGKSTLRLKLFEQEKLNLRYSISMTTRHIREGEKNEVDYYFVTKEQFLKAIEEDKFLEYAQFVDNYYGTLKDEVDRLLNSGYNVMLEIELDGAQQIMDKRPDALSIFIVPPSFEELRKRLVNRRSESEAAIDKRLSKAKEEMKLQDKYDYVVLNDDFDEAIKDLSAIIIKECKTN